MAARHGILPQPPDAGFTLRCPSCLEPYALEQVSKVLDELGRIVTTYRCRACEKTIDFADRHPKDAL